MIPLSGGCHLPHCFSEASAKGGPESMLFQERQSQGVEVLMAVEAQLLPSAFFRQNSEDMLGRWGILGEFA